MSFDDYYYDLTYVILFLASAMGMIRYRTFPPSMRLFAWYIVLTAVTEYAAYASAVIFRNNMPVYGTYNLLQFLLISIYFNRSIPLFREHNTGIFIGVAGVIVGIANIYTLQPLMGENSYFLFFEGIMTIGMVLFAFARIMIDGKEQHILQNPHFWIGVLLVFSWSFTFFNWALYSYLHRIHEYYGHMVSLSINTTNIITYGGFLLVFWRYPKWHYKHA